MILPKMAMRDLTDKDIAEFAPLASDIMEDVLPLAAKLKAMNLDYFECSFTTAEGDIEVKIFDRRNQILKNPLPIASNLF
jgi:hypothetical protein